MPFGSTQLNDQRCQGRYLALCFLETFTCLSLLFSWMERKHLRMNCVLTRIFCSALGGNVLPLTNLFTLCFPAQGPSQVCEKTDKKDENRHEGCGLRALPLGLPSLPFPNKNKTFKNKTFKAGSRSRGLDPIAKPRTQAPRLGGPSMERGSASLKSPHRKRQLPEGVNALWGTTPHFLTIAEGLPAA